VLLNAMDVRVWQSPARGAHLTNLLLHVLASLLLPLALMALGAGALAAWATALLFAAHPVHAESVAFISGRVDVLATIFILAAMACAAHRGMWASIGVGACTLLALLSKEIAFVLPLLLVLVWRTNSTRNRWAPTLPRQQMIAVAVAGLIVLLLRLMALGALLPTTAHQVRPEGALLLPFKTLLFAMASVFAPLRLISMEPDPQHLHALRLFAGALVAVVAWATSLVRLADKAYLWRALIASGVSLLLILNILPQETVLSERFLYLASGFLLVPVGAWFAVGWERRGGSRIAVTAAAVVLIGVLMLIANWRGTVWRTDVSVWRQAVHEEPHRGAFWDRLGLALIERRSYQEAEVALIRAVELEPENPNVLHNMGVLLQSTQRPEEAADFYRRAIHGQPSRLLAYLNLAQVLMTLRDYPAALEVLQTATRLKPDHLGAHRLAISAAMSARQPDIARQHLQAALRLSPGDVALQRLQAKLLRSDVDYKP
jgi:tetratricopeptide (TPR) repeat protein